MLALPCCRRGGSVDWGDEGDEGASATGSKEPPPPPPPRGVGRSARGGGGGMHSMSATDPVAFG